CTQPKPVIPANAGRGSIANSACAGPKGNNPVTAGFASKLAPTKSRISRETSAHSETPLQKAERNRRSGGHATWMSREPRGLQGRTLGAGLRGGGIREGSPASSGPYAGQAFLVPFVAFDKRDSPE